MYLQRSTEDASDPVLVAAKKLADILRSKKAFTNTATFDLKCEVRLDFSLEVTQLLIICLLAMWKGSERRERSEDPC